MRLSEAINLESVYHGIIPPIEPKLISIIIPVRNNEIGLRRLIKSFFETQSENEYPLEIIIVDNNSTKPISPKFLLFDKNISINIIACRKKGAAATRNAGAAIARGEWLLFIDSDCIFTESTISGYFNVKPEAIAYAGNVIGAPKNLLTQYYDDEETLMPNKKFTKLGKAVPLYLVTANAIIWKAMFFKCGMFDENFNTAGGEDVELARRLWAKGNIDYNLNSIVLHDFSDGYLGFCYRFIRYGIGNWQLQRLTGINMKPKLRRPKKHSTFNFLARLFQHLFMNIGYHFEKNKV